MNRNSPSRVGVQTTLRERLKEATNEAILQAAEGVFVEKGLDTAKMDEIATRAGVSVGTLYNHFQDRNALIDSLAIERRSEALSRLDIALEETEGKPFAEQVTAFVQAYCDHIQAHGAFLSSMIEKELCIPEAGRSEARQIAADLLIRAEALVERGVRSGALRLDDSSIYPGMLMGMIRAAMVRHLFRRKPSDLPLNEQVAGMVRFFLQGAGV